MKNEPSEIMKVLTKRLQSLPYGGCVEVAKRAGMNHTNLYGALYRQSANPSLKTMCRLLDALEMEITFIYAEHTFKGRKAAPKRKKDTE